MFFDYNLFFTDNYQSSSPSEQNFYNEQLFETETWLTITLSSLSAGSLLFITLMYLVGQVKSRDHLKESKKSVLKKLIKNEYLVFSYCLSLFFSHLVSISHKVITKFFLDGVENIESLCLIIGVLKHYFWLSALFHSNAVSFKIYLKLSKSLNSNLMSKTNWAKSALKIFLYIYGSTVFVIVCSVSVHFFLKKHIVYELRHIDFINSCFLSQPLYLIVFFAFPVLIILSVNSTLFLIVFLKTKTTIDQSESNEMNHLFLKLATIMGLSWFVYVVGVILIEIFPNHLIAQIIAIISSCQINLQGFIVVLGLYSNAVYDFFNKRKTIKNRVAKNHQVYNQQQQIPQAQINEQNKIYEQRLTVLY